jgi:hypothetical protein
MIMHFEKRNKRLIVFNEFNLAKPEACSAQRGRRFGAGKDRNSSAVSNKSNQYFLAIAKAQSNSKG